MEWLVFWAIVIAFALWRNSLADPDVGLKWPDRTMADPDREQKLLSALGPLAPGLSLSLSRCEWPREIGNGTQVGTRLTVGGACPQIDVRLGNANDVEVGDASLDGPLTLMGPPPLLRAIFDQPARRALAAVVETLMRKEAFKVFDGKLQIDVPVTDVEQLEHIARRLLAAAERLQAPADVPARLARNARYDDVAGVRLASLQTLVRDFPGHDQTTALLTAASDDADGEVRLAAARAQGAAGRDLLLSLARDAEVDDACSAQAVGALSGATAEELVPILEAAHPSASEKAPPRPYTARACVEALGRLGEDAVPLLDGALRSRSDAVALATIRVLDRIGGAAVVMSLQAAVEHHGGEVRKAARIALDDVRARLVGTPGQVSLAAGGTGDVSLADAAAGQVSLPDRPPLEQAAPPRPKLVE
jgi:hypothetical protein